MNDIFTKSENFKQEYSATIVKVCELKDIENSDNLKQAIVDGFSVVVNKNDVHDGDYMVYCKNETELNADFLSVNNMFEIGERQLNANFDEVEQLLSEGRNDEAKGKVGYFNKHGRVKMIKLRGCPSMGVLIRLENLVKWDKKLQEVVLADYVTYDENGNFIPFDFDTINGKLFIQAYIPRTNPTRSGVRKGDKRDKTKQFDRMVPGEWAFHYDTNQLNSNMWMLKPSDIVDISVKVHGTSIVIGNVLVKKPVALDRVKKWLNKKTDKKVKALQKKRVNLYQANKTTSVIEKLRAKRFKNYSISHGNVYSSRTVIKNQYINTKVTSGFYDMDIWGEYNELLKGKIPEDVTIYGEIVGYLTGVERMIQKNYDYGCARGTNKLMIYRVSKKQVDGTHREYEIAEVVRFAEKLVMDYPELAARMMPYTLLYHGTLAALYPNISTTNHWNENVLEAMKIDTEHFGMEQNEPLCKNKVPREGICLRIANDPVKECFKLKCSSFLIKESAEIDRGNVDIEIADNYGRM